MLVEEKIFDKEDFTQSPLPKGDYEYCQFIHCDFSNSDLSEVRFLECVFTGCNLSIVNITKTAFRDIQFNHCKMMGLHFESVSQSVFTPSFDNCILDHSSFYQTKLKKVIFKSTQFKEADFTECDLRSAVFDNCDLLNAHFENTILEKADLRTAFNYSIDPTSNKIKKARFALTGIAGLLDKYDIDIDTKR